MQWLAPPSGKCGRNRTLSDVAIQFCLAIKCLCGLPLRQSLRLVQTLLNFMGLHVPADFTGMKFLGEGEWKTKKHGAERRRQWRKVHLGVDTDTLQIRANVVTTNEVGLSPVGAELLNQIPSHETVASLTVTERMTLRTYMRLVTGAGCRLRHPAAQRSKAAQRTGIHSSQ